MYDIIGRTYSQGRHTDPSIAKRLWSQLDLSKTILNLGAGTGNYEPGDASLLAIEPSRVMVQQRQSVHPVIQASSEQLPLASQSIDQAMTVLSMHHWTDRETAFAEIRRVCRERFVMLTWDPEAEPFWLTRDYFPHMLRVDRHKFPTMAQLAREFPGLEVHTLEIPADCEDGFLAAYWCRPQAYLDSAVRECISSFTNLPGMEKGLCTLEKDLKSGHWYQKNANILQMGSYDAGYRLAIATLK